MQWYYSKNGSQLGPVGDTEIRRIARSGELSPGDFLWNESMGDHWQPASSIADLFSSDGGTIPPSLPGTDGTTPNRDLMKMSRGALKGRWAMAVLVFLLYIVIVEAPQLVKVPTQQPSIFALLQGHASGSHQPLVSSMPHHDFSWVKTSISLACSLLSIFLTPPLLVGLFFFSLNLARGVNIQISDLFIGFRKGASYYWKTVGMTLLVGLILIGWALLLVGVPIGITLGLGSSNHFSTSPWIHPVIVSLALLGMVALIIVIYSYAMVFIILADTPTTSALDCIRMSKRMMSGRKWKFFMLQLRFLGWSLLALLTCGIGFLWVGAYSMTAKAFFYLDVKGRALIPGPSLIKEIGAI
ncbi:MAG: DUF975 family protein [bacterium]